MSDTAILKPGMLIYCAPPTPLLASMHFTAHAEEAHQSGMQGYPLKGRHLASRDRGHCLSCHIMGKDDEQAVDVGPNLSSYARSCRSTEYTLEHIWDARDHNPDTLMPPFGTNELLSAHEIMHIIA